MKLLQINTTLNTGSTGRIAEGIGQLALVSGHESYAGYSKIGPGGTQSTGIKIGGKIDKYLHGLKTRILDLHGFGSASATQNFLLEVESINPDTIGLHNLHGYYLNIEVLFGYLKKVQKPVVWTFHDCWPFTGHCTYFDSVGCEKWKNQCFDCPKTRMYPASYGLDNSKLNYRKKKALFTKLDNLTVVTPSAWLKHLVKQSFLQNYPVEVIHNGIDLETFRPGIRYLPARIQRVQKKMILGVASTWDERKGLADFKKLAPMLDECYQIVLVGLTDEQIRELPDGIIGIARTENVQQLASLYSAAEVFVNPTWQDNFPTTNIEALACGTPVITYNTGGSPEAVDEATGFVVDKGDLEGVVQSLHTMSKKNRESYRELCRQRAVEYYNKEDRFQDYVELYERMLAGKH